MHSRSLISDKSKNKQRHNLTALSPISTTSSQHTMSFGYAVGDVIAVLGLFERISIELRNYKHAPAHFQQLSAELDLLRSTLQNVLQLDPANSTECQTLERIRAITMHCLQPLQALADKMQTKETSLGHHRSTRSLKSIGTRLHWSMIAQKDIDDLRKTILSEMVAVNVLLSVHQLYERAKFYSMFLIPQLT